VVVLVLPPNNLANLDTWNEWFPWIAAVFIAARRWSMWTSERANGTQELLFTLPATEFDLQLGKFLAYVGLHAVARLHVRAAAGARVPRQSGLGQLFANYVGLWLFGVMLVACPMIGSQLSHSRTVALSCRWCSALPC
jgi:ABC-2 type transport system permease protein